MARAGQDLLFPQLLAIGLMVFGIGIFAVSTSFVASKFVLQRSEHEELISLVKQENAILQAEIADRRELIKEQIQNGDTS